MKTKLDLNNAPRKIKTNKFLSVWTKKCNNIYEIIGVNLVQLL